MRKKTQQNQSFQVVYENVTEFEKALLTNQNTASHVLVLDVHATWCGKCNSVLSTFEKINMDYGDEHQITFGILDSQKLVAELNEIMKPAVRLGVPIMSARGSSKNLLVLGEDEVLSDEVKAKKLYKEDVKRKNYKALLETFVGLSEPHFLIFKEGELIRKVRGVNTPMIHKLIVQLLTNEPTEHPEEPKVDKHAEVQLQIEPEKEEVKPVEEKKEETPVVEEQKEEVIVEQAAEELKTETIVEETKVETAVEEEKKEETLAEQTTETKTETEVKTETKVETTATTETKTETTVDTTATADIKTETIEEKKVESSEAKTDSTAATECKIEATTKTTEEKTQAKQETTEIHEEESKVATESVSLETVEHSTDNHDITTTEKTTEVEAPPRAVDGIVFEEKHVETVAVTEEVESHGDQEVETKTETEVKTETKVDTTATTEIKTETKTETTVEQKVESSVETKTDTDKTVTSDIKTETTTETK